jgi:K+-sensing histidine kinase KdpD
MTNQVNKNKDKYNDEPFIEMVNHELKSPLATIKISAELLQKAYGGSNNPKLSDSLKKIDSKVDVLTDLINDYTDLVRINSNLLKLKKEKLNFDEVLTDYTTQHIFKDGNHELILSSKTNEKVLIDRERFYQVLSGLIKYVRRFSEENSPILIKTFNNGGRVITNISGLSSKIDVKNTVDFFDPEKLTATQQKNWSQKNELRINTSLASEFFNHCQGCFTVYSNKHSAITCTFSLPITK